MEKDMDDLDKFMTSPVPTANRPLLGLTVLVVEDSRFASEAMRLLCLRSGARIRRADCLRSARKHLQVYRPSVVIVDMGLPDGSGSDLLRELSQLSAPVSVLLATSGDTTTEAEAISAGAMGFLAKPVLGLSQFQCAILAHLPTKDQPPGPRLISAEEIEPDRLALQEDFEHIEKALAQSNEHDTLEYLANFIAGIAHSARDKPLANAANSLVNDHALGRETQGDINQISTLLRARIQEKRAI